MRDRPRHLAFATVCSIITLFVHIASAIAAGEADPIAVAKSIDAEIQKKLDAGHIPPSGRADDAEFLRRAYLDIIGRIPTVEQTTAFLDSTDSDKRTKLIDELLSRPEYGRHFATIWRDLLVDRTAEMSRARDYSWKFIDWLEIGRAHV